MAKRPAQSPANEPQADDLCFEKQFRPRKNQTVHMDTLGSHAMTIMVGPAGSAKTWLGVTQALMDLKNGKAKRIVAVRAARQIDEIGFLKGDLEDKMRPFLAPILDVVQYYLGFQQARTMLDLGILEISPISFVQGRTFNDAVLLFDEAQNATPEEAKIVLTRAGENSRVIVTCDPTQCILPVDLVSFSTMLDRFDNRADIAVLRFARTDVVRSKLVRTILDCYDEA